MQTIIPEDEKKVLHPVAIFKEGWSLCFKNLQSFIGPYLVIYLPILLLALIEMGMTRTNKPDLRQTLMGLVNIILSCWGSVVIINIAKKISDGQQCNFSASFKGSGKYLLSYLGAAIIMLLVLSAIILCGVTLSIFAGRIFWQINRVLTVLLICASMVAAVSGVVYFSIRWALYGTLCVVEEAGPIKALKRSFQLVRNYVTAFVADVGLLFLAAFVFIIPLIIIAFVVTDKMAINFISIFYNILIRLLIIPLWSLVFIGFYKKAQECIPETKK
ncbi:MAG: hypothetical protein ABSE81_03655 [Candidatus Omnitrophota bacterium]|jgi:hypothetical protein